MKDIISISEMAKLRGITTETLRHYDRIDLLKPVYVDPDTGYRYYAISQYEQIGTIRELKNLGMSLEEIKFYFADRNVESSRHLLMEQKKKLDDRIEHLIQLRREINNKVEFMDQVVTTDINDEVRLTHFDRRQYLTLNRVDKTDADFHYDCVLLEETLSKWIQKNSPVFASNIYGSVIAREDVMTGQEPLYAKMIIQYDGKKPVDDENTKVIDVPEGDYLCKFYVGDYWGRDATIRGLMEYMEEHGYELIGDIFQMQWIDFAISDQADEISYEFQAPVRKR